MTFGAAGAGSEEFERLAARIWTAAADDLPEDLRSLAVASWLATRIPDSRLVWHPGHRAADRSRLARGLAWEAGLGFFAGLAKIALRLRRFESACVGAVDGTLTVVPSELGGWDSDGVFTTPYLPLSDGMETLVVGPAGTCGPAAAEVAWSRTEAFRVWRALLRAGRRAASRAAGPGGDVRLLRLEWLAWALPARWLYDWCIDRAVRERLSRGDVRAVGSPHEMNAHARVVWRAAAEAGASRHTLQHAEVTAAKRWYFAYPEEQAAGVVLPDVMHVFDPSLAEGLAAWYPATAFRFGSSARYARWRDVVATARPEDGTCLVAGAMALFDNEVVLGAVEGLAADPGLGRRIVVRLHPWADVSRARRRALDRLARAGRVDISSGRSLADDLDAAAVVVGMSTTVLEEAVLLGRPAVQLVHPEWLRYVEMEGVGGATVVAHDRLDAAALEAAAAKPTDANAMRLRLGLGRPLVDQRRLLAEDEETRA